MNIFRLNRSRFDYILLSLMGSFLLFAKSAAYARILEVNEFGYYSKNFTLTTLLIILIGFGSQFLCQVRLPALYAQKNTFKSGELLSSSLTLGLVLSGLLLVEACLANVFMPNNSLLYFVAMAIGYTYSQYVFLVYTISLKSNQNFLRHAQVTLARSLLLCASGGLVAYYIGKADWVILSEMFITFLFLLSRNKNGFVIALLFRNLTALPRKLTRHVRVSIRFFVMNIAITGFITMDRWLGSYALSNEQFGVYSFGMIILTSFDLLQTIANNVIFPVIAKKIAHNDWRGAVKLSNTLFISIIFIGVISWYPIVFLLKLLIVSFYPQYVQLNSMVGVLVLLGFIKLSNYFGNISVLLGKEFQLTLYYIGFVLMVLFIYKYNESVNMGVNFFIYLSLAASLLLLVFNKLFSFFNYKHFL